MKFGRNILRSWAIVLVTLASLGCGENTSTDTPQATPHVVQNIAHRGGRNLWPEETLFALGKSVELGVDVLEIDVHASSDGVVVLCHDATVDRTTDGTGPISRKTLAELKALDAAYQFKQGDAYPYRGQGFQIATLEEVFQAHGDQMYSIEIKQYSPSIVDAVLDQIRNFQMEDRVLIASFEDDTLAELRQKAPGIRTSFGFAEMAAFHAVSERDEADYTPPAEVLQLPYEIIDEELMQKARRLGLEVQAWTVNNANTMREMIDLEVDGIITDDPVLLQQILDEG